MAGAGSAGRGTDRAEYHYRRGFTGIILILLLVVMAGPASAKDWTITTTDSLQANVTLAADGDTLILDPGTYYQSSINFSKSITLRANSSDGGTSSNTIIDAGMHGRIFNNTGSKSLTIDNLTLKNGKAADGLAGISGAMGESGGGIYNEGPVTITSSVIRNCTAGNGGSSTANLTSGTGGDGGDGGNGGGIAAAGSVTITASTITGSSSGNGGAGSAGDADGGEVWNDDHTTIIIGRGGKGGDGGFGGGVNATGPVTLTSSTISDCRTGTGGAGGAGDTGSNAGGIPPGSATRIIIGQGGEGGDGGSGAAIFSGGAVTLTGSGITRCSCGAGGNGAAGGAGSTMIPVNESFIIGRGGEGGPGGGAPGLFAAGDVIVSGSTMTWCTGGTGGSGGKGGDGTLGGTGGEGNAGGDIGAMGATVPGATGSVTLTSSTIANCSAGAGGNGGRGGDGLAGGTGGKGGEGNSGGNAAAVGILAYEHTGTVTVTSSTISNCTAGAGGNGGRGGDGLAGGTGGRGGQGNSGGGAGGIALFSLDADGTITVTSSTIANCTAGAGGNGGHGGEGATGGRGGNGNVGGGAGAVALLTVSADSAAVQTSSIEILSSTIRGCTAAAGGAGGDGGSGSTAGIGGNGGTGGGGGALALFAFNRSKASVNGQVRFSSATISECSAGAGGAGGAGSTGGNGGSGGNGGAVVMDASQGIVTLIGSTCTRCTAAAGGDGGSLAGVVPGSGGTGGSGGVVWTTNNITAKFSAFTTFSAGSGGNGNPAGSSGTGAAFRATSSGSILQFSRFYSSSASGLVVDSVGSADAVNTWWGTNSNPSGYVNSSVSYDPWLVLGITASPLTVVRGNPVLVRANLTFDSSGVITDGYVPDGTPVAFTVTSGTGTLSVPTNTTKNGIAETTLIPLATGSAAVTATVDGMSVSIPVTVLAPPPEPAPSTDSDGPAPPAAVQQQKAAPAQATADVNVGGNSAIGSVTVTGTGVNNIIVTGIVQPGPGANAPAYGDVYQYIDIVPARYTTVTSATYTFTVPVFWLQEHHIAPETVVMNRLSGGVWTSLPTRIVSMGTREVILETESPGFSLYAISGKQGSASLMAGNKTQTFGEIIGTAVTTTRTPAVSTPATMSTTAPPQLVPREKSPGVPIPLPIIAAAAILISAVALFIVRRWWIQRQNPALFRKYD